ncbi:MAG: prolyl oligopeptidase family serine peptidase [Litoreibacter sp.]
MKLFRCVLLISLVSVIFPLAAQACGVNSQCKIGDRHYYIAMPDGHDGKTPIPALIFAHGFQGSALGIMRNPRLRKVTNDLGVAFIAVKSLGQSWSTNNSPSGDLRSEAIELAYFDAVKKDVTKRFAIDPDKMVMGGASTGGMLTWTLACKRSDAFAGFIPMSGTFWAPEPQTCEGPVANIVHFHGDKDRTVPLNGRPVAGTHQGSVHKALSMYRSFGRFSAPHAKNLSGLRCENSSNAADNIVNFCLYDGRHSFRSNNVAVAWAMFRAAGQI